MAYDTPGVRRAPPPAEPPSVEGSTIGRIAWFAFGTIAPFAAAHLGNRIGYDPVASDVPGGGEYDSSHGIGPLIGSLVGFVVAAILALCIAGSRNLSGERYDAPGRTLCTFAGVFIGPLLIFSGVGFFR